MSIRILPREVVEKIAAGEVVERPVSVVKELVENALDAGARSISVEIEGGGCDLIRVSDDGCGIQVNDLPLALQRHATSKISSATDLDSITTLGFRGEALFSIAAVSHFTLTSRPEGSEAAHQLHVQDGSQVGLTRAARAPGTTVLVEQLFYNVPARRKFLRSPAGEASQIATLIGQLALAYPEVAFRLVNGGRTALATSGRGEPTDTVLAVLGRDVAAALLPFETMIEADHSDGASTTTIRGFVVAPRVNRPSRSGILLFVNRRAVKSRTLAFAVEEAYQTLLPSGRHPIAILDLQVPPTEVDVNVHPSKSEVKLLRERSIYGRLRDAVRLTLAEISPWAREVGGLSSAAQDSPLEAPRLLDAPLAGSAPLQRDPVGGRRLPFLRLMGQVAQTYIVAEGEKGLYLIDQHAAHERVLLHKLLKASEGKSNSQLLLEPIPAELPADLWELAQASKDTLESMGYQLEPFGERSLLIRAIPGDLASSAALQILLESLQDLATERPGDDWRERVAVALSCRAAVKAGQSLSPEEMRSLVEALEETDICQHCSHGRPTAVLLSHQQLEREFGRK